MDFRLLDLSVRLLLLVFFLPRPPILSLSALLQERFKQLERVREKREAREKIAAPTCNSKTGFERKSSSSASFSSTLSLEMMNTSPRRQRKAFAAYERELNREDGVKRRQRLTNWWPDYDDNSVMANLSTPCSDQISEVDTSLHL